MKLLTEEVVHKIKNTRIAIIGEAIYDAFLEGTSDRLSREAPVPIVDVTKKWIVPGGGANTAINLAALGAQVTFISVVGKDKEGEELKKRLEESGISSCCIVEDKHRQTLTKQRINANSQAVVRFDTGSTEPINKETEEVVISILAQALKKSDGLIVSDYAYGILTQKVIKTITRFKKKNRLFVALDAKQYSRYRRLEPDVVKPSYNEFLPLLNLKAKTISNERIRQVVSHEKQIFALTNTSIAIVTLDKDGALLFEKDKHMYRTYAQPAKQSDTSGAGDTFITAFTLGMVSGMPIQAAAELASTACDIAVRKPGTTPCYLEELQNENLTNYKYVPSRIALKMLVEKYKKEKKRVVFTNGCFDILHSGHVIYLNQAKSLGDVLIVGVNTDASVKRYKGKERPINPLSERLKVLSGLSSVDHVIEFNEDNPINLIKIIKPDVFVKGGDYKLETLPEASVVTSLGGTVEILPYINGRSTTNLIKKIERVTITNYFERLAAASK